MSVVSKVSRSSQQNLVARRKPLFFDCVPKRWKVSISYPPLDSLEKPCSFVLMEDQGLYEDNWTHFFQAVIPKNYGMSFASITFPEEREFDKMLEVMKFDLKTINDAVLVARGPLSSWCAQFYLESFSLQGLVMIDPVLFDQIEGSAWDVTKKMHKKPEGQDKPWNGQLFQVAQSKSLNLEPNAVPMLVLHSLDDETCAKNAMSVAKRHSSDHSNVPVKQILQRENPNKVIKKIDSWIDSIL